MSTPKFKITREIFRRRPNVLRALPDSRRKGKGGPWKRSPFVSVKAGTYLKAGAYTFSLSFCISFRLAMTMPVRANSAMTLGRTIRLLNMSVSSQTKSLPETVPRKMNTSAMMV